MERAKNKIFTLQSDFYISLFLGYKYGIVRTADYVTGGHTILKENKFVHYEQENFCKFIDFYFEFKPNNN